MSRPIDEFEGFENGEITFLVELLACMRPISEIQGAFKEFTAHAKTISQKDIAKISLRYAKKIREQRDAYLNNIEGNPLAHLRIRLDIALKIINDSLVERPSHSIKVASDPTRTVGDSYEVVLKRDNPTALNALKLAHTEMAKMEELKIKRKEAGMEDDEDPGEWNINTGMAG